jgi:hypothetical protein
MYSYGHFRPGGKTNTSRLINYIALYNRLFPNSNQTMCFCIINKYDKNTLGSDSSASKLTYSTRISKLVNSTKGGKTQYGNFYLGEPLNINYLGRIQGMSGGSGCPPVNKF